MEKAEIKKLFIPILNPENIFPLEPYKNTIPSIYACLCYDRSKVKYTGFQNEFFNKILSDSTIRETILEDFDKGICMIFDKLWKEIKQTWNIFLPIHQKAQNLISTFQPQKNNNSFNYSDLYITPTYKEIVKEASDKKIKECYKIFMMNHYLYELFFAYILKETTKNLNTLNSYTDYISSLEPIELCMNKKSLEDFEEKMNTSKFINSKLKLYTDILRIHQPHFVSSSALLLYVESEVSKKWDTKHSNTKESTENPKHPFFTTNNIDSFYEKVNALKDVFNSYFDNLKDIFENKYIPALINNKEISHIEQKICMYLTEHNNKISK